jgi:hypothetical protein
MSGTCKTRNDYRHDFGRVRRSRTGVERGWDVLCSSRAARDDSSDIDARGAETRGGWKFSGGPFFQGGGLRVIIGRGEGPL